MSKPVICTTVCTGHRRLIMALRTAEHYKLFLRASDDNLICYINDKNNDTKSFVSLSLIV